MHKRKVPKVYKNKKLNNANFGTYNLNDYQTFLLLVSKLGKTNADGTYMQPEQLEREHLITAKEFHNAFGVELASCYRVLRNAGKRLMETSITLEKPELFVTQQINVCSKVEYQHKEGLIKIKLTDDILPYLAQVKKKFVLYNLKEVANFGSLYSTRLYELIQEFKDTGWLVKSVAQLREIFAVGKKYAAYKDFKLKTFAHAVDEINSQYPTIKLRFEEIKEGRKVISIDFRFTPSTIIEQYNPVTKQLVSVTSKPKQVKVSSTRKTKKDDDNTPPPIHPDQQELPHLEPEETPKTITGKILKAIGSEPEQIEAAELGTSHIEASKKVVARRVKKIKDTAEKTAEEVKEIINALKESGLTETEATIKAIKLKLI